MALPLIVAGIAARAAAKKVATNAIKKAATKKAATKAAKANARALKAAKGPSLASKAKKLEASSGRYERNIAKIKAEKNQILGSSRKEAYSKAAKTMDKERAKEIKYAKKILARAKTEKNAATIAKATKSNYKTPSLAKTQAKGVAKLAGAGIATGAFTQIPAVKQSIKYQIKEANKNKKPAKKTSTKKK
jgi:hypothetical protein